jgi:hypothetical protein
MKAYRPLLPLLIFALVLSACSPAEDNQQTTATSPASSPIPAASTTTAAQDNTPIPPPTGMPPQTNAAEIRPPERRSELLRLSGWLDFQVKGMFGGTLGQVSDYIINTCETYVVYVVMEPVPELELADNQQALFPFEAVTINSGALDVEAKAIVLSLVPSQFTPAPVFPNPLPLFPIEWEAGVRDYWSQIVRVGKLNTNCAAGGDTANPVQKIAYATELLTAELKDGNQQLLGTVQEAIIEPETGKLGFYVVKLAADGALVLVPLGKTNIPEPVLQPGIKPELVLLAENPQLQNAPRLASLEEAVSDAAQNTARGYWGP